MQNSYINPYQPQCTYPIQGGYPQQCAYPNQNQYMQPQYGYPMQGSNTQQCYPMQAPNAVSINIYSPQAFGQGNNCATNPMQNPNGFYSLYGNNPQGTMPNYPSNYNNLPTNSQQGEYPYNTNGNNNQNSNIDSLSNKREANGNTNLVEKTPNPEETKKTEEKTKKVTPLTDDYIKSLENYMNDPNPKIRLIGAKEVMERFKEDENRKDNPSLMALLNKALRDTSPSVRFLGLTSLQSGYALGNDETVSILQEIQSQNQDKIGEDARLASEILLDMAGGQKVEVPMTQNEIEREKEKQAKKESNK